MSRRETRDSDSRHHRSRFDRESSPKLVRRDGKGAMERPISNLNLEAVEHVDRDQKHHRRLQDSLHTEAPVVPDSKTDTVSLIKESEKKSNGYREGTKSSSDNVEPPQSRSYLQHDERARQVGRTFRHREITERKWWKDSEDCHSRRTINRSTVNDDIKYPSKKRPSFRETKIPVDAENGDKSVTEAAKPSYDLPPSTEGNGWKEGRGKPPEKPPVGRSDQRLPLERDPLRAETQMRKFQWRDRYVGRGRDGFNGRKGQRVEKWKHDLYDEANKSPNSKNEEDQIAKVEALLSS